MTRSNIGLPYYRCETQGAYLTDENTQPAFNSEEPWFIGHDSRM
jgi:hypothetical protein